MELGFLNKETMSRFDMIIGYGAIKEQMNMALDAMLEPENL